MPTERDWLQARGFRPKRRLGQNFLLDTRVCELIVERAGWPQLAPILEIGPGGGALTRMLLDTGHPVAGVEKDGELVEILRSRFFEEISNRRLRVIEGDALSLSIPDLQGALTDLVPGEAVSSRIDRDIDAQGRADQPPGRPWIAGNLPYPVTTALLLQTFSLADVIDGAVIMVQREYGERLLAEKGTKAYGSITVWTQAHAHLRQLLRVGRSAFWPRPGVESIVLELRYPKPSPYQGDFRRLEQILRASFGQRRKTLQNALSHGLGIPKEEVGIAIKAAGTDPGVRGETLSLAAFSALVEQLPRSGKAAD